MEGGDTDTNIIELENILEDVRFGAGTYYVEYGISRSNVDILTGMSSNISKSFIHGIES